MLVIDLYHALGALLERDPDAGGKPVDLTDARGRACRWNGDLTPTIKSVQIGTRVYRTRTDRPVAARPAGGGSVLLSEKDVVTLITMLEGRNGVRERARIFSIGDSRVVTEVMVVQLRSRMLARIRLALTNGRYAEAYGKVYRDLSD